MSKPPLSPFRWKEDPRPSIFLLDPHFRSRHKAGLIKNDDGLNYKQFGTRHTTAEPLANIHTGTLNHEGVSDDSDV
jgi:hypothetical protein